MPRSETSAADTEIQDWTIRTPGTTAVTTSKKPKTSRTSTTKKQQNKKKTTTTEAVTETTTTAVCSCQGTMLDNEHFAKHGGEFDGDFNYSSPKDYEKGASDVINNKEALHKTESEDGDGVYYIEDTNEFVILSTDGYIRTYFRPNGGKSYYDRQ